MTLLITGIVVLIVTVGVFVMCLPRKGKMHRFVGTEIEPYVAVALTAGVALSFTLTLSGILGLIG